METLNHLTDQQLSELLRGEDIKSAEKAYKVIYDRWKKNILTWVILKVSDIEDCEDIVHNVFIALWTNRKKYRIHIQAYLFGIAKHKVLNCKRSHKARREILKTEFLLNMKRYSPPAVYGTIYCIEIEEQIIKVIDNLPPKMAITMRFSLFDNMPLKDIAKEIKTGQRTVENYRSLGLKALRDELKKEYSEYIK